MKVAVHFLQTIEGGLTVHSRKVVDADFLSDAMDAIEYNRRDDKGFQWLPSRELQVKLIQDALPDMYADPLHFSWPFRRAMIEEMAKRKEGVDE